MKTMPDGKGLTLNKQIKIRTFRSRHISSAPVLFVLLIGLGDVPGAAAGEQRSTPPSVDMTPSYVIEAIQIKGNGKTRDYVIRQALGLSRGQRLPVDDARFEISRYRVLSLGFFSDVRLRLKKGSARGRVILVVEVEERGTIILTEAFFGTSDATSAWGGIGIAENNFLGRGISVEGAFVLGADPGVERGQIQQSYRLRARSHQLGGSSLSLCTTFLYLDGNEFFHRSGPDESADPKDYISTRYRRIGGAVGIGFHLLRYTRMYATYRGEAVKADVPSGAVRHLPEGGGHPINFDIINGHSFLSGISVSVERDTRSDTVLPGSGSLFTFSGDLSSVILGSSYNYGKFSASYQVFFPLSWGHAWSVQGFGGVLFGEAPFFEKFFIGDFNDLVPGRSLGLNFSTLPSRNIFKNSIVSKRYEKIALRVMGEYIIPWFRGGEYFYGGDFFFNVGLLSLFSQDDYELRDRSVLESVPLDLTFNAGLRLDTRIGIFHFSLGNTLGRIPF